MAKILGYREMLKTLVEYHITFIERLAGEGYEPVFSILLLPWRGDEERLREGVLPLLRQSDRLFYIDDNIIALLPGADWNGAMTVRRTIADALGIQLPATDEDRECIVEYPTDGTQAFELIGNLYARCEEG